jgi:hypothetical protein
MSTVSKLYRVLQTCLLGIVLCVFSSTQTMAITIANPNTSDQIINDGDGAILSSLADFQNAALIENHGGLYFEIDSGFQSVENTDTGTIDNYNLGINRVHFTNNGTVINQENAIYMNGNIIDNNGAFLNIGEYKNYYFSSNEFNNSNSLINGGSMQIVGTEDKQSVLKNLPTGYISNFWSINSYWATIDNAGTIENHDYGNLVSQASFLNTGYISNIGKIAQSNEDFTNTGEIYNGKVWTWGENYGGEFTNSLNTFNNDGKIINDGAFYLYSSILNINADSTFVNNEDGRLYGINSYGTESVINISGTLNNYSNYSNYGGLNSGIINILDSGVLNNYGNHYVFSGQTLNILDGDGNSPLYSNSGSLNILNNANLIIKSVGSVNLGADLLINSGGGVITNNGLITHLTGHVSNSGAFTNNGSYDSTNNIFTQGVGAGKLTNESSGTFINNGTMNIGKTLDNYGHFVNNGQLAAGFINNSGAIINNYGHFENTAPGVLLFDYFNNYGGQVDFSGTVPSVISLHSQEYHQTGSSAVTEVNGYLGADIVDILNGTLKGSGFIKGDVTVGSGAVVEPGNSPGTLTIDGDFILGPGATLALEIGENGLHDRLVVSGSLGLQVGSIVLFELYDDPTTPLLLEFDDIFNQDFNLNDFIVASIPDQLFGGALFEWLMESGDLRYLEFNSAGQYMGYSTELLDDIPSVPEPLSILLMLIGIVAMVLTRTTRVKQRILTLA